MHNVDLTIERLRSGGATIEEANAPPGFESAHPVQRHIMVFEAARNLGPDVARAPETRQRCLPVDDRERRAPPGARGSHAVTLPSGTGPAGLPLGLQICACAVTWAQSTRLQMRSTHSPARLMPPAPRRLAIMAGLRSSPGGC